MDCHGQVSDLTLDIDDIKKNIYIYIIFVLKKKKDENRNETLVHFNNQNSLHTVANIF